VIDSEEKVTKEETCRLALIWLKCFYIFIVGQMRIAQPFRHFTKLDKITVRWIAGFHTSGPRLIHTLGPVKPGFFFAFSLI
jgi:hypothetical protein